MSYYHSCRPKCQCSSCRPSCNIPCNTPCRPNCSVSCNTPCQPSNCSPPTPCGNTGSYTGYAEYVQTSLGTNSSVAAGSAISYLDDYPSGVVDTIGIITTSGPGGQGTEFLLPKGVYMIDFENSSTSAISQALYTSLVTQSEVVNSNTAIGTSVGATWLHGRSILQASSPTYFIVSPIGGSLTIPVVGTGPGLFTARLTILKVA